MSYRVPLLSEVRAMPRNGIRLVSTFSGCGGSCLGFEMAGFEVLWSSEFVPAARETYLLNRPGAHVDDRDIRMVDPAEILRATGLGVGELDVLEGSPPCAAFSTAGRQEKDWGKVKRYSDTRQRVDDLFFEYVRILDGLKPRAFVAENVPGLVRGKAVGYLKAILAALRACGYRVAAKCVSAHRLGVPQSRERLIFVGVREDLGLEPVYPVEQARCFTLRDAISDLEDPGQHWALPKSSKLRRLYFLARQGEGFDSARTRLSGKLATKYFTHRRCSWDRPAPTICAQAYDVYHPDEPRSLGLAELRRISAFPDDFRVSGTFRQQWERYGRAVPPLMMREIARGVASMLEVAA